MLTASLCGGSSCHCANPAQLDRQVHVKCDTTLGSPLRHAFSVCAHYIVCVCVHFVYVCVCVSGCLCVCV